METHAITPSLSILVSIGFFPSDLGALELLQKSVRSARESLAIHGALTLVPSPQRIVKTTLQYYLEPPKPPQTNEFTWGDYALVTEWLWDYIGMLQNLKRCAFLVFRKEERGREPRIAHGEIVSSVIPVGS